MDGVDFRGFYITEERENYSLIEFPFSFSMEIAHQLTATMVLFVLPFLGAFVANPSSLMHAAKLTQRTTERENTSI